MTIEKKKEGANNAPIVVQKKKELTSDRRQYKLMQVVSKADIVADKYDWSSSDEDSDDEALKKPKEPRVLVVKSKYGKTRPLDKDMKFTDRPAPVTKPPPSSSSASSSNQSLQTQDKGGQMPYIYASDKTGVVLTRGQYLDLIEAKEKKKQREEIRNIKKLEEKDILQRWMCDPRIISSDWTVHYSTEHKKCYFFNSKTNVTTWKPPEQKIVLKPKTPDGKRSRLGGGGGKFGKKGNHHSNSSNDDENNIKIEPAWIRNIKSGVNQVVTTVDKTLPTPPRFIKRFRRKFQFFASSIGLGSCFGPRKVEFHGSCAEESYEIVEALGLSQQDLHV